MTLPASPRLNFLRPGMATLLLMFLTACGGGSTRTLATPVALGIHDGPDETILIGYPNGVQLYLDIYLPTGPPKGAMILNYHGGGWVKFDRKAPSGMETGLQLRGYVVAACDYRLLDQGGGFPTNFRDCRSALRWCQDHAGRWGVDPNKIAVMGESAGAHLAALVAVAPPNPAWDVDPARAPRPAAAVCQYGTYDFRGKFTHYNELVDRMVGGDDRIAAASPANWVDKHNPPILIMHGIQDAEPVTPVIQAQHFYDLLRGVGAPCRLILVNHAGHGFVPMDGDPDPTFKQLIQDEADFLDEVMK